MKNTIFGIIAGLATCMFVTMLTEKAGHMIHPPPVSIDNGDMEALKEFIAGLPMIAFVLLIAGWALSSFLGGFVAGKVAKTGWKTAALVVGGISMVLATAQFAMIPHPSWVPIVAIILYLPMAYFGGKLGGKGHGA